MTPEETLREVNGLLGAVDGRTLERVRRLIKLMNVYAWGYEQMRVLLDLELPPRSEILSRKCVIEATLSDRIKAINALIEKRCPCWGDPCEAGGCNGSVKEFVDGECQKILARDMANNPEWREWLEYIIEKEGEK